MTIDQVTIPLFQGSEGLYYSAATIVAHK